MVRATRDNVFIEKDEPETKLGSGLLEMADESIRPPQTGTVISVGPDWLKGQVYDLKPGDRVLFALSADQGVRDNIKFDGKDCVLLVSKEVIAKIGQKPNTQTV